MTIFASGRVTIMVMPPRIGPRNPRRVYLALWRKWADLTLDAVGGRFEPPISKSSVLRLEQAEPGDNRLTKGAIEAYAEALNRPVEDMYRRPPPKGTPAEPSLDHKAAEMGIDRSVVIDILAAMRKTG